MPQRTPYAVATAALVALTLSACSAQVGAPGTTPPPAQTVTVSVAPDTARLAPGQGTQFAAVVTGTADEAVRWYVDEVGGGSIDENGVYTAPAAAGSYHVRAVSRAQAGAWGLAEVEVAAPPSGSVLISPKSIAVAAGGSVTFTATVANLPSSAVTWSVQEASGCGTISNGVYRAPSAAAVCHVVATSAADGRTTDVATVTVNAPVRVTITPATATVDGCRTVSFAAGVSGSSNQGVTWSVLEGAAGGTITAAGVYTAPEDAGTYHVVARAAASSAATAQATITVRDSILAVAVDPPSPTLAVGGVQQFTATVTTTCGAFVVTGP